MQLSHSAQLAIVREIVRTSAARAGLGSVAAEQCALAASEAGQNVLDHGGGRGDISIEANALGLEVVASDRGPGIDAGLASLAPVRRNRGDGTGLAAIGRAFDVVEVFGRMGLGTLVRCVRWGPGVTNEAGVRVVIVRRALRGEIVCGDDALVLPTARGLRLAVIDGLGHGEHARVAAARGCESLSRSLEYDLPLAIQRAHEVLADTRGAALAVADIGRETLRAACVNNVRVQRLGQDGSRWSSPGVTAVVGHGAARHRGALRVRVDDAPWRAGDLLAMYSDGVRDRIKPPTSVAIVRGELATSTLALFAEHARDTDDATLLLAG